MEAHRVRCSPASTPRTLGSPLASTIKSTFPALSSLSIAFCFCCSRVASKPSSLFMKRASRRLLKIFGRACFSMWARKADAIDDYPISPAHAIPLFHQTAPRSGSADHQGIRCQKPRLRIEEEINFPYGDGISFVFKSRNKDAYSLYSSFCATRKTGQRTSKS